MVGIELSRKNFSGSSHVHLVLTYETTANQRQNTSSTKLRLYAVTDSGWSGNAGSFTAKINSTTIYNSSMHFEGEVYLGNVVVSQTHDNYGRASINWSCSGVSSGPQGSASANGTLTLPQIDRITRINTFTGTDIEKQFTATYTQVSDGVINKIKLYVDGNALETRNCTSGVPFYLSESSKQQIYAYAREHHLTTIPINAKILTYVGDTRIGNSSTLTVNIQSSSVHIKVNNEWKTAVPYVRVNGEWKLATAYTRINGEWRQNV